MQNQHPYVVQWVWCNNILCDGREFQRSDGYLFKRIVVVRDRYTFTNNLPQTYLLGIIVTY